MAIRLSPKILSSSMVLFGMFGTIVFGGNELSKKTISDSLGEVKLVSYESESGTDYVWNDLTYFFIHSENKKSERFKKLLPPFLNTNNLTREKVSEINEGLRKVCKESSTEIYYSFFQKKDNYLMDDVKSFCSLKINQIFDLNVLLDTTKNSYISSEKDEWKKKLDFLNIELEKTLDNEFLNLKKSNSSFSDDEKIDFLFQVCKKRTNSYYVNNSENFMNFVGRYCTKEVPKKPGV